MYKLSFFRECFLSFHERHTKKNVNDATTQIEESQQMKPTTKRKLSVTPADVTRSPKKKGERKSSNFLRLTCYAQPLNLIIRLYLLFVHIVYWR